MYCSLLFIAHGEEYGPRPSLRVRLGPRPSNQRLGRRNGPTPTPSWATTGPNGWRPFLAIDRRRWESDGRPHASPDQNRGRLQPLETLDPFLLLLHIPGGRKSHPARCSRRRRGGRALPALGPLRLSSSSLYSSPPSVLATRPRDPESGRPWQRWRGVVGVLLETVRTIPRRP
jgi:hypothetical protein